MKKKKKKILTSRLAVFFSPNRWTENYLSKGGLVEVNWLGEGYGYCGGSICLINTYLRTLPN